MDFSFFIVWWIIVFILGGNRKGLFELSAKSKEMEILFYLSDVVGSR